MNRFLLFVAFCLAVPGLVRAELTLPHFFSDHMVLQRERQAAIWGNTSPGAEVAVEFRGNTTKTKADDDGSWKALVGTGQADATGSSLTITSGSETKTLKDVLVGEVWFASGQSNMAFTMNRVPFYEDVCKAAKFPAIRFFNAPTVTAVEPQTDIAGEWTLCSPSTTPGYSAVAFFFARKLHQDLGVPIGVIKSAWGGKPVETFTSREALMTLPGTKQLVEKAQRADDAYDADKAKVAYESRLDQWKSAMADWKKTPAKDRKGQPRRPSAPKRPFKTEGQPGVLFDSMIHPFVGYTMKGAIWYQGEANAKAGKVPYDQTLPLMIRDWRQRWDDDFSFLYVQLANFKAPSTEPGTPDPWALLQDRMRLVLETTPKTGMAVINDVGAANDIHPKNKKDPGERLARWALAKDYGQDVEYSGPLYQGSEVVGQSIRITFDSVAAGLKSRDGDLKRFEIAGKDKKWYWGDATINSPSSVLVSNANVPAPVAVRYAWASNPEGANLVNSEGLPTSVFRTDDWQEVLTEPAPAKRRAAKTK